MQKCRAQSFALLTIVTLLSMIVTASSQILTDQLSRPDGIATDLEGNIFVHSDNVSTSFITKFAPNGVSLGQLIISSNPVDIVAFAGSRLATDPFSGLLIMLSPFGSIFIINPQTFETGQLLDIRAFPVDTQNVFDVQTGRNFPFVLVPQATYGDIALYRPDPAGQFLDLFITGISAGFPFVMRIIIDIEAQTAALSVILTSSGTTAGATNLPRGIAVTPQGVGITSFSVLPPGGVAFQDVAVAFPVDFPEAPSFSPQVLFDFHDMTSWGMTSDAAGNIYVATGSVGNSRCHPGGSGALVFIPNTYDDFACLSLNATTAQSRDVTVSPIDQTVYMTVSDHNVVLQIQPLAAFAAQGE